MIEPPTDAGPAGPTTRELLQSGYRYALSLTHHPHNAEDLVQEAWLNLSRRYGQVDSLALLIRSVRNLYIDRCRRDQVIAFESDTDLAETTSTDSRPPGLIDDLDTLLAQLRPIEREALYLHHVAGHTAEEIGHLTGQPRGSVLSLLHRSLQKLRQSFAAR